MSGVFLPAFSWPGSMLCVSVWLPLYRMKGEYDDDDDDGGRGCFWWMIMNLCEVLFLFSCSSVVDFVFVCIP